MAQVTLQQSYFACPACGKRAYDTRTVAKRAAKALYPDRRMRAYRCRGAPWWHITSDDAARAAEQRAFRAGGSP